ncbi:MAG: YraN family protein [Candidatus Eisenbacteria bacterium]|nr:YraN family protein [Candidatus Eisenbacteria bacterium]
MGENRSSDGGDSGRDRNGPRRVVSGRIEPGHIGSGHIGEAVAALFLQLKGYRIVARNVRTRASELDIVARKADCLVFVEVKLRGPGCVSAPAEAVDWRKRVHMVRGAAQFIHGGASASCGRPLGSWETVRFDVLSVSWTRERLVVEHIEDAFTADGATGW